MTHIIIIIVKKLYITRQTKTIREREGGAWAKRQPHIFWSVGIMIPFFFFDCPRVDGSISNFFLAN